MAKKVAIVTGSNQGIGLATVKRLCKEFDGDVYLTARNVDRGLAAVSDLEKGGFKACFHQLDICDHDSILKLRDFLKEKYQGLDLLVNNAGIAYKKADTAPFAEQTEVTMATNFTATLDVCNVLFPLLRDHARVVHLSSMAASMTYKRCSDEVKQKILSQNTIEGVEKLMADFVQIAKDDKVEESGWTAWGYGVTKIGVRLMTPIQQKAMDQDSTRKDIIINCCCPGFVATNMSSYNKNAVSVEEGCKTSVYLSLLPPNNEANPKGRFLSNLKVKTWDEG